MKLKTTRGYGYVGTWRDGTLGWHVAPHVYGGRTERSGRLYPSRPNGPNVAGENIYLCRITITPVKDKRGRYIVRRAKP